MWIEKRKVVAALSALLYPCLVAGHPGHVGHPAIDTNTSNARNAGNTSTELAPVAAGVYNATIIADSSSQDPSCPLPAFLSGWVENTNKYPLAVAEAHGAVLGTDLVIISGFYSGYDRATPQVWAKDATVPDAEWRRMDDIPIELGVSHASVVAVDLKLYLCGGFLGDGWPHEATILPDCLIYDHSIMPGSGSQWDDSIPDLPVGRAGGGMIYDSATDTLVFAGGTHYSFRDATDTWALDLEMLGSPHASWRSVADIPFTANHMSFVTATDSSGPERHFFLGGQIGHNEQSGNVNHNYEYVVSTNQWIEQPNMLFSRSHASSSTIAANCGFLIAGGSINSGQDKLTRTSDISYFDAARQQWVKVGDLPVTKPTPVCAISPPNAHGKRYMHCATGSLYNLWTVVREVKTTNGHRSWTASPSISPRPSASASVAPSLSPTTSPRPSSSVPPIHLYVNAGADEAKMLGGVQWQADTAYAKGGNLYESEQSIDTTKSRADEMIYQTERFGDMTYTFTDLDHGEYLLRLHFAEIYSELDYPGGRIFDVVVQDKIVFDGVDVYASSGGLYVAWVLEVVVSVSSASLKIDFLPRVENPKVSGIELHSKK